MPTVGIEILEMILENIFILITTQYMAGKRLKEFNYKTLVYFCIYILYFLWLFAYNMPDIWTMPGYLFLLIYIVITFKQGIVKGFWILLRSIVLVLALQIVCSLPFASNAHVVIAGKLQGCFVNSLCIIIVVAVFETASRKQVRWGNIINLKWSKGVVLLLGFTSAYIIIFHKQIGFFNKYDFVLIFFYVITVMVLVGLWQKMVFANHEKERKLEKLELLEDTYKDMVLALRGRQHEFNNHLSVIQSQHTIYKTYDELVASQEKYIDEITRSIKYYDLLHLKNPALSGLLNIKFSKAEEIKITVSYEVEILAEELPLSTVELIEIVSVLLDNAIDYLQNKEDIDRKMTFTISDKKGFNITVANAIRKEDTARLSSFFNRGYSTKGKGHGYGLFNVKNLVNKNKGKILIEYKETENMLYITVQFDFISQQRKIENMKKE